MQDDNVAPATDLPAESAGLAADNPIAPVDPAAPAVDPAIPAEETPVAPQDPAEPAVVDPAPAAPAVPTYKIGREVFDNPEDAAAYANKIVGYTGNLVGELRRLNPNLTDRDIEALKVSGGTPIPQPQRQQGSVSPQAREALRAIGYENDDQVAAIAKAMDVIARDQGYVKSTDPLVDPAQRADYEAATNFFSANPDAIQFANAIGALMDTAKASGQKLTVEQAHQAITSAISGTPAPAQPATRPAPPKEAAGMGGGNAAPAPAPAVSTDQVSDSISELVMLQ